MSARRQTGPHRAARPSSPPDPCFGRRRARFSLLATVVALLVCGLHLLAPAPADAQSTPVWSSTFTVAAAASDRGCLGTAACAAQLSDSSFDLGGTTYAFTNIAVTVNTNLLIVRLTENKNTALQALKFCVGSTAFEIADTTNQFLFSGGSVDGSGLGWSIGDTVPLSIGSSCPQTQSSDATLSGLTASSATSAGGTFSALTLTPSTFSATTTSYTATVPNATTHVKLTPTVNHASATVQVGKSGSLATVTSGSASDAIALSVGANAITVRATAQDGTTTKNYTVTVTRQAAASTVPTGLQVTAGDAQLTAQWTAPSGVDVSRYEVQIKLKSVTNWPSDDTDVTGTSHTFTSLGNGSTYQVRVRTVEVGESNPSDWTTPAEGTPQAAQSSNANLSALTASSSTSAGGTFTALTLSPSTFSAATTSYTATVPHATTHVKLTPTVQDSGATVTVQGTTVTSGTASDAIALTVGANALTVRVTAEDSTTTKDYTVTVTRQQAPAADPPAGDPPPSTPPPTARSRCDDGISRDRFTTRLGRPITLRDECRQPLYGEIATQPDSGTVTVDDDGLLTYTPDPGALGEDSFELGDFSGRSRTITIDNGVAWEGRLRGARGQTTDAQAMLTGEDGFLRTTTPDTDGIIRFYGLPDGDYALKVRLEGYRSWPSQGFSLDIERHDPRHVETAVYLQALAPQPWVYYWAEDASPAGRDYAGRVEDSLAADFLAGELTVLDDASAQRLWHDYRVILVDTPGAVWTQEHAWRLLETLKAIPRDEPLAPSRWQLSTGIVAGDIEVTRGATGEASVVVSTEAFGNAQPRHVGLADQRRAFYSRRLHHALVEFVTNAGKDAGAVETILRERYGLTTEVSDWGALTASTTRETGSAFQAFGALELVELINALEDMPAGLRLQSGLDTLVRRRDGTAHPLHPEAPLVGWPEAGYVEVMESAFEAVSSTYVHRCLVYERGRVLWAGLDDAARYAWRSNGGWGWYRDRASESGWSTYRPEQLDDFCGPVGSPGEDLASSLSAFVAAPETLRARSRDRHAFFVRDRVLPGLFSGYAFAGKVRSVDIAVSGLPQGDKTAYVTLELHALWGVASATAQLRNEWGGRRRLDLSADYFADEPPGVGLRGSLAIGRHAPAGYWRLEDLAFMDGAGEALEVDGDDDFGWLLYVDNPLERDLAPAYVAGSLELSAGAVSDGERAIRVEWEVVEDRGMRSEQPCRVTLSDEDPDTGTGDQRSDGAWDAASGRCRVDARVPSSPSRWRVVSVQMADDASNVASADFGAGDTLAWLWLEVTSADAGP